MANPVRSFQTVPWILAPILFRGIAPAPVRASSNSGSRPAEHWLRGGFGEGRRTQSGVPGMAQDTYGFSGWLVMAYIATTDTASSRTDASLAIRPV